ncbi:MULTISPECIES: CDP-glycerol glycerophosphotransferase family protein [unclassified Enterococcus]|uniref:CDP-glycerol glycerophosphotransferase family protein n=1 Tax=unclassified Enterococcus TaxID=2608891 RepID=UPI00259B7A88|nr:MULTISPECIES: CDP-glycerol glycerophosphotransferase family protein [unclassified Enterococcus]MDO0919493.1 CDP-glycerol glycerophosphotransferase family protein [Enterococcus sp. B1E2]WIV14453.1 CDP-glycerol glycerophosphotransferase family protein [Enterococcus sp. FZMF]
MNIEFKESQDTIVIDAFGSIILKENGENNKKALVLTHLERNITKKIHVDKNSVSKEELLEQVALLDKGEWLLQFIIECQNKIEVYNVKAEFFSEIISSPFYRILYRNNECILNVLTKKLTFSFIELNTHIITLSSEILKKVEIKKVINKTNSKFETKFEVINDKLLIDLETITSHKYYGEINLELEYCDGVTLNTSAITCINVENEEKKYKLETKDISEDWVKISSKGTLSIVNSKFGKELLQLEKLSSLKEEFTLFIQNENGNSFSFALSSRMSDEEQIANEINNIISEMPYSKKWQMLAVDSKGHVHQIMYDNFFAEKVNVFYKEQFILVSDERNSMVCINQRLAKEHPIFGIKELFKNGSHDLIITLLNSKNFSNLRFYFIHRRTKNKTSEILYSQNGFEISIDLSQLNQSIYKLRGLYDLYCEYDFQGNSFTLKVTDSIKDSTFLVEKNIFSEDFSVYQKVYLSKERCITVYGSSLNARIKYLYENEEHIVLAYQFLLNSLNLDEVKNESVSLTNITTEEKHLLEKSFVKKETNEFLIFLDKKEMLHIVNEISNLKFYIDVDLSYNDTIYSIRMNENKFEKFSPQKYKRYPEFNISDVYKIQFLFAKNELILTISSQTKTEVLSIRKNTIVIKDIFRTDVRLVGIKGNEIFDIAKGVRRKHGLTFEIDSLFLESLKMNNSYFKLLIMDDENNLFNILKGKMDQKKVCYKSYKDGAYKISWHTKSEELYLDFLYLVNPITKSYLLKNRLAYIGASVSRLFNKNPTWLVGENFGISHQDNGYLFFSSSLKSSVPEKTYFVTRQLSEFSNQDNLLVYDSFKHLYKYHLSSKLIVSHGVRDAIPSLYHYDRNNDKSIYHLQHGIIAMKKVYFNPNSYRGKMRKMVVSSQKEADILIKNMDFRPVNIMVTGLTRYDYLVNSSYLDKNKEIFVMPTWRDWLVKDEDNFKHSDFFKYYYKLLNDKDLSDFLIGHNIVLKFLPHIEMLRRYGDYFKSELPNIDIVDSHTESIQDLIKSSSLLVTDYSSVAFDFAYLNKPIIFFQFDVEEYMNQRGAFINFNKDLFGDRCKDYEELKASLIKTVENNYSNNPFYRERANQFFDFHDDENFLRTYQGIKRDNV